MLIHEFLDRDTDIVPEESILTVFYRNYDVHMDNNVKDTKHTRHTARSVNFVRNGKNEKCTRLTDVNEVCNWQTLRLIMLVRNFSIPE